MKSYKSYITTLASAVLFMSAVFATSGLDSRQAAFDAKFNANEAKNIEELISVKQSIHETLSIGDPFVGEAPATRECEFDWTAYGSPTCDTAWDDFGISCADLEANYGWDCAGCDCPGDIACEDQGLVTCDFDGSCAASLADCPGSCEDTGDFIDDCSGDGDCCPLSWIGDGFEDCEDQQYGCDLTCYDNDGGDCSSCEEQGLVTCDFDGSCAVSLDDCPEPSETCNSCELDWSAYGSECCDTAWDEYGIDCATLEGTYGWDCAGCNCPGDVEAVCGDGVCSGDETYLTCPEDCDEPGECGAGLIIDCDGTGECWADSWVGDGYCDGTAQQYGADLCCYDNDGGDCTEAECAAAASCEDDGLVTCPDGSCAASVDDCPLPGECGDGFVADCSGNCLDNSDTQYAGDGDSDGDGCLDTVYDCVIDNGTCEDIAGNCYDATGACTGETTCPDGMIGAWSNDTLCDDGDFGVFANCEELCFDDGACGTQPDPDCTIGDGSNCPSAGTGDVNGDMATNVLDIVQIVNYILGSVDFDDCTFDSADINGDGAANVLDIVAIVNVILDGRSVDASSARVINEAGTVTIDADGFIGAVQMTLTHGADFSINLTDNAMVAEYATKGNITTLIVVAPEDDQLFTSNGEFEITEMIVANSSTEINVIMATEFSLMAAYPNPFNPSTTLSLNMPADGFVSVKVFNLMGRVVATLAEGNMEKNTYSFTWNASEMPSGVYMVRAEAMGEVSSQKLMLLK